MGNEPRQHHYVPRFYLRGFTDSAREDGQLWVHDRKLDRRYPSNPANVARERDFNRVDLPEGDPNAVEAAFAALENRAAPIFAETGIRREVPTGEDLAVLMQFAALQLVRVLLMRDFWAGWERQKLHLSL